MMLEYSLLYPLNTETRTALKLDGMWRFALDWKNEGDEKDWKNHIPGHDTIPIPASFQDFYTDKKIREFAGDMWYETDVLVPDYMKGSSVYLRFGAATHRATVYLNGEEVAYHEGGFLPFLADITDKAKFGESNRVVVKINNELNETNIPCGLTVTLSDGRKMVKPYFDFYNYSGLQRSVYLLSTPENSIEDIDLSYSVNGKDASIDYEVRVKGDDDVKLSLYDEEGHFVTEAEGRKGIIIVPDAKLWQVRASYLYTLKISLVRGNQLIDSYQMPIGIREVRINGENILINGSPVYMKGFGKHEDSDIVGRGFNIGVMKRDFELMKWIGANSFRTSHYPYDEEIYRMADREGFLIIDEVPGVGLFESLVNFLDAGTGKGAKSFFSKPTTPILLKAHLRAVEEMIARDKNHPSVIAWSLFNEPETTEDSAVPYFEKIFARAREVDPQKRPRTFAMIGNSGPDTCKCCQLCDFLSLNRYYGWYNMGGYEISDAEEAFREEMDGWEKKQINRPVIFTEYGADTNPAEHKLPSVMWSQEYQVEYLEMCHRVFDSYDFVAGELVWNFADFQTTEGIMRMNGNRKGIFTRQRQPKEAAYYFKKRWEELPVDYKK